MEFIKTYTAKDEHIDFQNIMDGLYYPFYMEWCRHDYIKEVLGFDSPVGVHLFFSKLSNALSRTSKSDDLN